MDGDDADSIAASTATGSLPTKAQTKCKFACHFYKMNQHLYASCGNNGYGTISHLGEHLRKEHSLTEHSCQACWLAFDDAEALEAHNHDTNAAACRATGGTPICRLRISKTRIGDYGRWFWIWRELFPHFQKPKSPYWKPLYSVEQYYRDLQLSLPAQLAESLPPQVVAEVMATLSRHYENWVTNPPEPRHSAQLPTPTVTRNTSASDEQSEQCSPDRQDIGNSHTQDQTSILHGIGTGTLSPRLEAATSNTRDNIRLQQSRETATDPFFDGNAIEDTDFVLPNTNTSTKEQVEFAEFADLDNFDFHFLDAEPFSLDSSGYGALPNEEW
ncbi:hypothetical protein GGR53DRAFT_261485 [Hypoxylon sp. FL1150]|nr:hypothetical protein GGR53DRAFT_261485 [Hypoxylon sp. FL1150]